MKQYSDDEQGFIPAQPELKDKLTNKNVQRKQVLQKNSFTKVQYRFSDGFMKKEPNLVHQTPLSLFNQPLTSKVQNEKKQKSKSHYQTPYREYCVDQTYILAYSRFSGEPLSQQRAYMKNEVLLLNIEDKNSPSLKQLKLFEIDEKTYEDDTLEFDSRFQCGNLHCAFRRRGTNQYHLFISNDTNSLGYNQWFYFSIRNAKKNVKYSFRIVNYKKMIDFYRCGQRIALFSYKQAQHANSGWSWNGNNINFQQSSIRVYSEVKMYTLKFDIQPKHSNDYIMLAPTVPYSYSRLLFDLQSIATQAKSLNHVNFSFKSVCSTLCDNDVPQITITAKQSQKPQKQRKIIIFMARQHPGQVWSSYMALGVIRSLIKPNPDLKYIVQNCIVKIYPMINVDGVIYGNFRCDVTGVDLNRRWKQPSKIFHPQLFQIKKKIQNYAKKSKVQACFDLHGHSKKYNIFCYSCKQNSYTCRILPYLISSQNRTFSIPSCTFGITRDKQTTARATISRIIRSQNVLTIQTSTFGERMDLQARQFNPIDIYRMAQSILLALRYFIDKKSSKYRQSEKLIKQNYQEFIKYDKDNEQQSGSQSEPELDEIDFKIKIATIIDKKFSHQQRSFAKDAFSNAQLHRQQITLHNHKEEAKKDVLIDRSQSVDELDNMEDIKKSEVIVIEKFKDSSRVTDGKRLRPSMQLELETLQKHSVSMNKSELQSMSFQKNPKMGVLKVGVKNNILIRDKKRLSFVNDIGQEKRQIATISVGHDDYSRPKDFRDLKRQQQNRKSIQNFVNKYERYIPSSLANKTKARLDVLQQGLNHDDGQFQLNLMLENKRRLELEKLKQRIEQSTEIAERQGKIKWNNKKEPIIDYRRFKRNDRIKQQVRKLGELSQRYLDGHH